MNKLLLEWQKTLNLSDWEIKLQENCSPNDMTLQGVQAETEWDEVNKCAVIRIIDEKDYGKRILPFDKEKALVHELLHIKLWWLQNSDCELQNRFVHQLIDDMAVCFIKTKRK